MEDWGGKRWRYYCHWKILTNFCNLTVKRRIKILGLKHFSSENFSKLQLRLSCPKIIYIKPVNVVKKKKDFSPPPSWKKSWRSKHVKIFLLFSTLEIVQKNFATIFLYEFIPYVKSLLNHKENINFYSNDWFSVLQKYNIENKIEVE